MRSVAYESEWSDSVRGDDDGPEADGRGRDRWLLSYADLLTLLFALFVVLFATAWKQQSATPRALHRSPTASPAVPELQDAYVQIRQKLESALRSGKVDTRLEGRGLVIELSDASYFLPGDDSLPLETRNSLDAIAHVVSPLPNRIAVEGHADATAIHNSRFADNWQLSAARGLSVVRYLAREWSIPSNRLSAAAFADTRPRSGNDSEAGRARNRRVDIVVMNSSAQ